ncbi:MAG: glycosyltransferase [Candidatus Methanomethylicaceae archaeon]
MRIAIIGGFSPDPYGEAHYTTQVSIALAKKFPNADIVVFAHKNNKKEDFEQVLHNLNIKRVTRPQNRFYATVASLSLIYHLFKFKPSVVHLQGTHTPLYGGLFGEPITVVVMFLRLLKIPCIMTIHSTWFPSDLEKLWKQRRLGAISKLLNYYYRANLYILSKLLNRINLLCAGDKSPIPEIFARSYKLNQSAIHNEPHPCFFKPVSPQEQKEAKKRLGFHSFKIITSLGFVRADKGYHLILECADYILSRHPDVVIIIAGQPRGSDADSYVSFLRELKERSHNKDRVLLKFEYINDEELEIYFKASDIIVVPYLRSVGPSGPIHHAFGYGKPVIASAIGHNLGLEGVCRLFPAGDSFALAQILDEWLSDPKQLEMYAKRSIEYARKHTWEILAQKYMEAYEHLISKAC